MHHTWRNKRETYVDALQLDSISMCVKTWVKSSMARTLFVTAVGALSKACTADDKVQIRNVFFSTHDLTEAGKKKKKTKIHLHTELATKKYLTLFPHIHKEHATH